MAFDRDLVAQRRYAIRMVRAGLSANEALERLRAKGLGMRRQYWLKEYRTAVGIVDAQQPTPRSRRGR
jgi:hypothetical protein